MLGVADAAVYNACLRAGTLAHPDTLRIAPGDVDRTPFELQHDEDGTSFVALDATEAWLGVVTVEHESGREKRRHIA